MVSVVASVGVATGTAVDISIGVASDIVVDALVASALVVSCSRRAQRLSATRLRRRVRADAVVDWAGVVLAGAV